LEYQTLIAAALFIISSERAFIGKISFLQDEKFQTLHHEILFLWPFIKVDCAETEFANNKCQD
jgi:hypothetical protein